MNGYGQPTDWEEFEKAMLRQFSFLPEKLINKGDGQNEDWVGEYVQKMLRKALPQTATLSGFPSHIAYNMFETHRNVIVRCTIPKGITEGDIRIAVNRRKLKLKLGNKTEEILLLKEINPARAEAEILGGNLEIRIPKSSKQEQFHDVHIL